MSQAKPGIYYHFKDSGKLYEVLGVAKHTEREEEKLVIYRALYGEHKLFARPEKMFLEMVDKPEYNYRGLRFVWVKESK